MDYSRNENSSPAMKRSRIQPAESPVLKAANKRLSFDFQSSPMFADMMRSSQESTPAMTIDEDSCDSGFSESSQGDLVSAACNDSYEIFQAFTDTVQISPFDRSQSSASDMAMSRSVRNMNCRAKSASSIDSFNDAAIMEALEKLDDEQAKTHQLVGDMKTQHALPVLQKSKHKDLASISPDTLVDLMNGKYADQIEKFVIFDARFPYEFEGGHIAGAQNVFRKEDSFDKLFAQPMQPSSADKRVVIIFHCEFSSERGPRLMREVRERDRILNAHHYPNLHYPEMYLLEGGYKSFFESFDADYCEPRAYLPMLHDNHRNDLKFFRKKSKTWGPDIRRPLSLLSSNRTPTNRSVTRSRLTFN